jgi:hypothetical protein
LHRFHLYLYQGDLTKAKMELQTACNLTNENLRPNFTLAKSAFEYIYKQKEKETEQESITSRIAHIVVLQEQGKLVLVEKEMAALQSDVRLAAHPAVLRFLRK